MQIPGFLYGTAWKEELTERCVLEAVAAGFRGIDTANQRKHYFEEGVGKALARVYAEGTVNRADLFLQTKFTLKRGQDHRLPYDPDAALSQQVRQSFESSLAHLGTDYLDSYVLHGPSSWGDELLEADWEAWRAMEGLHGEGKTRYLGVSNVNAAQLRALCAGARVKPKFAQIRCYAKNGWERAIRQVCAEHGIVFQPFSILTANREVFECAPFRAMQARLGCTGAQVIFAYARQQGWLPLTGTKDPRHMREDLDSERLSLTDTEIAALEDLRA